ncbi:MAG TPA: hypothetical protein ENK32_01770 [Anaerolineae bacterium]|nr:hypothetical protein [Anaerolineae bacterium]
MSAPVTSKSFRCLTAVLEKPALSSTASARSYPCSDKEMIARYGMRYATPEELRIFPIRRLVIRVIKARILKIGRSPYLNPNTGVGWIVWAVESYPGAHQFRMLNGDLLQEEYNEIEWERVPDDTAVTTRASARRGEARRQWQQKIRSSIRQNLRL